MAFLLLAFVLLPSSLTIAWMSEDLLKTSHDTAALIGACFLTVFYRNLTRGVRSSGTPTEPSG